MRPVQSLIIFMVAALVIGIGSFAFADTQGEVKEYSGTVSYRYDGGFFLTPRLTRSTSLSSAQHGI